MTTRSISASFLLSLSLALFASPCSAQVVEGYGIKIVDADTAAVIKADTAALRIYMQARIDSTKAAMLQDSLNQVRSRVAQTVTGAHTWAGPSTFRTFAEATDSTIIFKSNTDGTTFFTIYLSRYYENGPSGAGAGYGSMQFTNRWNPNQSRGTFFGFNSGNSATNAPGWGNSAFGASAMRSITTGATNNCGFGYGAAQNVTSGAYNNLYGANAAANLRSGSYNTVVATNSLYSNRTYDANTCVGHGALYLAWRPNHCVGLGREAGANIKTATGAIFIGAYSDLYVPSDSSKAYDYSIALGYQAKVSGPNQMGIGGGSTSSIDTLYFNGPWAATPKGIVLSSAKPQTIAGLGANVTIRAGSHGVNRGGSVYMVTNNSMRLWCDTLFTRVPSMWNTNDTDVVANKGYVDKKTAALDSSRFVRAWEDFTKHDGVLTIGRYEPDGSDKSGRLVLVGGTTEYHSAHDMLTMKLDSTRWASSSGTPSYTPNGAMNVYQTLTWANLVTINNSGNVSYPKQSHSFVYRDSSDQSFGYVGSARVEFNKVETEAWMDWCEFQSDSLKRYFRPHEAGVYTLNAQVNVYWPTGYHDAFLVVKDDTTEIARGQAFWSTAGPVNSMVTISTTMKLTTSSAITVHIQSDATLSGMYIGRGQRKSFMKIVKVM